MRKIKDSGFVQLVPMLVLFVAAALFALTLSRSQFNVFSNSTSVLSESDESGGSNSGSGSSGSGSSGGDETRVESNDNSGSGGGGSEVEDSNDDANDDELETEDENEVEDENENENETDRPRFRTEVKYTSKGELERRLEIRNAEGRFRLRTEGELNRITIRESDGQEVESKVSFRSSFPVSVDPTTGVLTITTPRGTKEVAILPEDAIANMLSGNVVNAILTNEDTDQEVEFEEEDTGELVYVVDGASQEKLFGLFDVYIPKKVKVSAEDGQIKEIEISFFNQILDRFSF